MKTVDEYITNEIIVGKKLDKEEVINRSIRSEFQKMILLWKQFYKSQGQKERAHCLDKIRRIDLQLIDYKDKRKT